MSKTIKNVAMFFTGEAGKPAPSKIAITYNVASGIAQGPDEIIFLDNVSGKTIQQIYAQGMEAIAEAEGITVG